MRKEPVFHEPRESPQPPWCCSPCPPDGESQPGASRVIIGALSPHNRLEALMGCQGFTCGRHFFLALHSGLARPKIHKPICHYVTLASAACFRAASSVTDAIFAGIRKTDSSCTDKLKTNCGLVKSLPRPHLAMLVTLSAGAVWLGLELLRALLGKAFLSNHKVLSCCVSA